MATEMKKLVVYFRPDQAERLEEIAKAEQRPIAGLLRIAVDQWLAHREQEAAA